MFDPLPLQWSMTEQDTIECLNVLIIPLAVCTETAYSLDINMCNHDAQLRESMMMEAATNLGTLDTNHIWTWLIS